MHTILEYRYVELDLCASHNSRSFGVAEKTNFRERE